MITMKRISLFLSLLVLVGCNLSPGMYLKTSSSESGHDSVYVESIGKELKIFKIEDYISADENLAMYEYRIGIGDQILITVWGLPEVFPLTGINLETNLRRVDSTGNIYFPYVGLVNAKGLTQNELRGNLTERLSEFFTDPQLDVGIGRFNSQKVYILGEITKPSKINLTDIPFSLSDALGEVNGLNTNTSNGSQVFIIRHNTGDNLPQIFIADMSSPANFINSGNFFLKDNDIIYVNASGTTRWNRVISQFFPFSTFLASVNSLSNSD